VKEACSICVSGIYELGMFGYVSGMLRVGAVLDKEICELNGNLQKAHERKLRMI
jgi:hypothetical protein